jgi:hypothetical protein
MIVKNNNHMYTSKRKYIQGSGFGSYILENKDLIAKPLLSAVGNIGAMALTEGSKYLLNKLANSSAKNTTSPSAHLDEKSKQIIEELKRGSGIKKF